MPKKSSEKSSIQTVDWLALRNGLIAFSLSLIIGTLVIFSSYWYYNYMNIWEQQQRRSFGSIEIEYVRLQQALEIVNNLYVEKFNQLKNEGFFNEGNQVTIQEQYLQTSNDMRTLMSQLPLFKKASDYTFSDQEPYLVPGINESNFRIYKTEIKLKLDVLHEGDILTSIETIELQKFSGLFNLQNCDIKRNQDEIDTKNVSQPYFTANCMLVWYVSLIEK